MNKRGSAQDVILIAVLLFFFGVAFLIMHYGMNQMYDGLLANPQINGSASTVEALEAGQATTSKLDYWGIGIFLGLLISLIVTGWFISGNPLFMGVYVVVVILAVVVSMGLSNAWESLSQNATFAASLVALPFTNHILLYLPYYTAVMGMIGLMVVFAKPFFQPGGDL